MTTDARPAPPGPYTADFFDGQRPGSESSARVVLPMAFALLGDAPPRRVADLGCGTGT